MKRKPLLILVAALAILGLAFGLAACRARQDEPTQPVAEPTLPPAEALAEGGEAAVPLAPAEENTAQRAADGMVMIRIPAGDFLMGSDESPFATERPAHTVTLDEVWMDQMEVSNVQYRRCVAAEACTEPTAWENGDLSGDDQPALVTWGQARAYCQWVGGRLPTEAEWEKAARGTDGRTWPWGNEFEEGRANLSGDGDGYGFTAPVGSFPAGASPYGLLDMAGNAAEWVADRYDAEYYAQSPVRDPTGPATGEQRVYRSSISNGGGGPEKCRCVARYGGDPEHARWTYGFRCAAPAPPEP